MRSPSGSTICPESDSARSRADALLDDGLERVAGGEHGAFPRETQGASATLRGAMTSRPKTARATPTKVPPASEVPVTRAMLYGVRDELAARIDQTNARLDQTNARLDQLSAETRASTARIQTLTEEQEARNRVVLEVVQGHNDRFDRIEADLAELKGMFREVLGALSKRP